MSEFIEAARIEDIPESGKLCLELDDQYVVLVRVDGQYFCLDDICTHDGGTLGDGELRGYCLSCPRHGAEFDVRTGEAVTMPATEATGHHEVRVDGPKIFVRLSK
jgi:3-phenylpropionate/trans-cinnamate dioxygenase ferredoxin component